MGRLGLRKVDHVRVLLLTFGSRGDTQPFVALASGLVRERGWQVRLSGPARFADLAAAHGIDYHRVDDAVLDLQDLTAGSGPRAALAAARRARPLLRRQLESTTEVLRGFDADVVVHHPKALAGPHLAEKLRVPAVAATLQPLYLATSEFALPVLPGGGVRVPRFLARRTWRVASMIDAPYRGLVATWRRDRLGLAAKAPTSITRTPAGRAAPAPLHPWSPHILPSPTDWPPEAAPTGDWHLADPDDWAPPETLARFLDDGDPPVYVGFGSMIARDPAGLARTVLSAVRAAGARAVLTTGWGGLRPEADDLGPDVCVVDDAPHGWLLPRTAAVVHHGGAGTVHAAARAGRPQVIRPFIGDQPFWAGVVYDRGLASPPLTGRLTADRLSTAITAARTPRTIATAQTVAAAMRTEDGVAATADRLLALVR